MYGIIPRLLRGEFIMSERLDINRTVTCPEDGSTMNIDDCTGCDYYGGLEEPTHTILICNYYDSCSCCQGNTGEGE